MYDTDVLVIGAGPTGLTLAASLVARGIATTVVDRQAAGANTSRAAVVNARTLEVLEDLDVARRLVKEGVQAPMFTIRDRGRTLIPIDFSGLPTKYPYSLMVPQSTTERLLLERLEELGGSVLRPKDGDRGCAGFRRCDGDLGRRRRHPSAIRRGRRRYPQHRARAGRYRVRGRRVRGVVRAGRRPAVRGRAAGRGHPVLGESGSDRGRAAARGRLPNRRAGSGRARGTVGVVRPGDPRHPGGAGTDGRHRPRLGFTVPDPPPRRRHLPRRPAAAGR